MTEFFMLIGDEYECHPDIHRYCASNNIGKNNILAKMETGIGVITRGKNQGTCFSFADVGKERMLLEREKHKKPEDVLSNFTSKAIDFDIPNFTYNEELNVYEHQSKTVCVEILSINSKFTNSELRQKIDMLRKDKKYLVFFCDEWENKKSLVNSMIENHLGLNLKIGARACKVSEISSKDGRAFLKDNHLAGTGPSGKVYIGLTVEDMLVSVMSFSEARYNKTANWELLRYASLAGVTVQGGASKMMKFAKSKLPGIIVSYADQRYSVGNVYEKIGFNLNNLSPPCYWYIDSDGKRYHRSQFQKHKLANLLKDKFDPSKTEIRNMIDAGYSRVFDAGHLVYILPE